MDTANRGFGGDRIAPEVTEIAGGIAMPEIAPSTSKRGIKSAYPFASLEINQSFGVRNKTLKQVLSVVSGQNRKHLTIKLDSNGHPMMREVAAKRKTGETVTAKTTKPIYVATKKFVALPVDPATDPAGASVRVWRVAV